MTTTAVSKEGLTDGSATDLHPRRIPVTAVGAAALNVAIYGVARAAGLDFVVRFSDQGPWSHIGGGAIATVSALAVTVGVVATWIASRRSARLTHRARIAGAAIALASVGAPMSAHALDAGAKPCLAAMHLVVGAAYLYATRTRGSAPEDPALR